MIKNLKSIYSAIRLFLCVPFLFISYNYYAIWGWAVSTMLKKAKTSLILNSSLVHYVNSLRYSLWKGMNQSLFHNTFELNSNFDFALSLCVSASLGEYFSVEKHRDGNRKRLLYSKYAWHIGNNKGICGTRDLLSLELSWHLQCVIIIQRSFYYISVIFINYINK